MRKWMWPGLAAVALVALLATGTFALAGGFDSGDNEPARESTGDEAARCADGAEGCVDPNDATDGDDKATDGGVLGMCAPGVTDCVDMVVDPNGDVSSICLEGSEDCNDTPSGDKPAEGEGGAISEPFDGCPPDDLTACRERVAEIVRADLETNTGAAVDIIDFQYVEWPDASLGNPQPDMAYAQVITPGFKVIAEAGGQQYEYHTDLSGGFTIVN